MRLEFDILFFNANLATMDKNVKVPYGMIKKSALGVKNGKIVWLGREADLPKYKAKQKHDCESGLISPGLIDCHTHLIFAGNRAKEFEMRLQGKSYEQIARSGGGIVSTVKQTRAASHTELLETAGIRLLNMMSRGITTIEIKSGYGLDFASERKMLEVAQALSERFDANIIKTYLGAHAIPPEYKNNPDDYIDLVCEMMEVLAKDGLIDAVDGFCENIGFNIEQIEKVFITAKQLNLPIKLHAEQLSNQGGAKLAARYNALSTDHLEYIDEAGVKAMAEAGIAAVLLPGAFYFLGESKKPPIDLFRKYNIPMAVATDCNPGSSPLTSPVLAMNMACNLFGLTPEEALEGMTINAAKALGLAGDIGSLEIGKRADLCLWDIENMAELSYFMADDFWPLRIINGKMIND